MANDAENFAPRPDFFRAQVTALRARGNWEYIAGECADMQQAWHSLIGHFASAAIRTDIAESPVQRWFDDLRKSYDASDRHYHTLEHIGQMLAWIRSTWDDTWETCLIGKYAAWFHDAVYDSTRTDNEERSAELALRAATELNVPPEISLPASDWIARTKTHVPDASPACAHFLDCDLAILGAPRALYSNYASAIRREYAWVGDRQYREGRAKVLRGFLDRQAIYRTHILFDKLESTARDNIAAELSELENENA